ncbi:MAG: laccase domain-containing protein [Verrucomicrobia bacterium]|nr:MAG: laccase domain-containing protein [Verrucomicrobiota bacterium]TAE85232.1 MAG: laccase domain-containing protein [Verrucomicrobiota bacterium]TAF22824.1 MAG: laccase domain-containing protein [Verrucomicrobiota bacterium]TAF39897.1 MAG: laccase domain-containing protein [Verrucomicrobiota bacterium]
MTEALSFLDPINSLPGFRAGWIGRIAGIEVDADRDRTLSRLRPAHESLVRREFGCDRWWRAEQVHGDGIARVPGAATMVAGDGLPVVPGVDGLITSAPGETLGIYVADCGALWLADRGTGASGLLHSGKKGTELGILTAAIERMGLEFGTRAADLVVVLGPCIRPPHYEVDFAAEISRQAERAGVGDFHDAGEDTACDLTRHYSYRVEKGKTGRMLALIHSEKNS